LLKLRDNPSRGEEKSVVVFKESMKLASAKGCEAEINYQDDGTNKVAVRVRLFDR